MLAWAEGTGISPATALDGYDVIVTGIDRKPEVFKDFSPISQDMLALQHVRECRALPDVHAGRIETAIKKCQGIWASLLGAGYGQREQRLEDLIKQFRLAGGTLS